MQVTTGVLNFEILSHAHSLPALTSLYGVRDVRVKRSCLRHIRFGFVLLSGNGQYVNVFRGLVKSR